MRTYLECKFEAEDLDEAKSLAEEMDGEEFTEQKNGSEWETFYNEVELVKED